MKIKDNEKKLKKGIKKGHQKRASKKVIKDFSLITLV